MTLGNQYACKHGMLDSGTARAKASAASIASAELSEKSAATRRFEIFAGVPSGTTSTEQGAFGAGCHWLLASQCMRANPVRSICSSCMIPELGRQRIDGGQGFVFVSTVLGVPATTRPPPTTGFVNQPTADGIHVNVVHRGFHRRGRNQVAVIAGTFLPEPPAQSYPAAGAPLIVEPAHSNSPQATA